MSSQALWPHNPPEAGMLQWEPRGQLAKPFTLEDMQLSGLPAES